MVGFGTLSTNMKNCDRASIEMNKNKFMLANLVFSIVPSTLFASRPNQPQGLKFKTHFTPCVWLTTSI